MVNYNIYKISSKKSTRKGLIMVATSLTRNKVVLFSGFYQKIGRKEEEYSIMMLIHNSLHCDDLDKDSANDYMIHCAKEYGYYVQSFGSWVLFFDEIL